MADIINLRRARKDKARREHEREAEANRLRFGRNKAQKSADRDAVARSRRSLTGSKSWSISCVSAARISPSLAAPARPLSGKAGGGSLPGIAFAGGWMGWRAV